jgi:hypothetical protein
MNITNKYLIDIFPEYQIDPDLDIIIKLSATEMSNEQHKQINEMISYINDGNYFGESYRNYLLKRREANDFWISVFYPVSTKDLIGARKVINNIITKCLNLAKQTLDDLNNKLQIVKFKYENVNNNSYVSDTDTSSYVSDTDTNSYVTDTEVKNKNTKIKNTKSKK